MKRRVPAAAMAALVAMSVLSTPALGHERRNVGPYTFVVGWLDEPAFVNTLNGLTLAVTETAGAKPVEGLEKTLHAEAIVGGGAARLPLMLAARFGQSGNYQSPILPTKTGDYTFHIIGTVGTTKIDEKFESGPGRFNPVEDTDAIAFPAKITSGADFAVRLDNLQTLVVAGVAMGALALVTSIVALVMRPKGGRTRNS